MHKITKLKNGITFITVPVKGTRATTVLAMFPIGSRFETPKLSGASHFVEHMMFKGTKKRPEAKDISRTLERFGADYNAYTYKDYTGYYVKIGGKKQEVAFDLLSDMIFNSQIKEAEVEKEKGAIVEELRMYEDNPTMAIDLLFDRTTFPNNQLGWDIGGSETTVRGMTRQELWNFYQTHYNAKNMVLVVAGNVDAKKAKKFADHFAKEKSPEQAVDPSYYKKNLNAFSWPTLPLSDRVGVMERKVDQAHLILGFPGFSNNDKNRHALTVLLNILGVGMSSRLFIEVREKRGLAYMVRTGSASYRDCGVAYVQAGLDPARLQEALTVIERELKRITEEPITKAELEDAKNNIAGRWALAMEDSSTQADWFAKQYLSIEPMQTPEIVLEKIKKVSVKDIQKVAQMVFDFNALRLSVIAPEGYTKEKILAMVPKV